MRTDQVSMLIVDQLEIVKVEKHRRNTRAVTTSAFDLVNQKLAQITRIVQPGEIVSER